MKKIFTIQDKYGEYKVGCCFSKDIAKEIAEEADKRFPFGAGHVVDDDNVYESVSEYIQISNEEKDKLEKSKILNSWKNDPLYRVTVQDSLNTEYCFSYFIRSHNWPNVAKIDLLGIPEREYSGKGKYFEMTKRYVVTSVEFMAQPGEFYDDYDVEHFIKNLDKAIDNGNSLNTEES